MKTKNVYVIAEFDNGYVNGDNTQYYIFNFAEDTTDEEIQNHIDNQLYYDGQDWANDNIIGVEGYDYQYGWETEEDEEFYFDNIDYSYEIVTKEQYYEIQGIDPNEDD